MLRRWFLSLFCLIVLACGLSYGFYAFRSFTRSPGPNAEEVIVLLPRGSGLGTIVNSLDRAGVIDHPWLFQLAVRLGGHDRMLKAGEYAFPAGVTPDEVITKLTSGKSLLRRLTVIEGQTVAETFRLLESAEALDGDLPEKPAEGTLLPETYLYSRSDTKAGLVKHMQEAMTEALDKAWATRDQDLPFDSPIEALTMASIVDKETAVPEERFAVAAVFVNRLRLGMRLQSDPTIIYALTEGEGPLDRELTRQDWKLDDPYNTYRIEGLPPGPIGNPGRLSIEAAMHPADVDFLYFVADGTGGHAFAVTLDEHNDNVARWRQIKAGAAQKPEAKAPSPRRPDPAASATPAPGSPATADPSSSETAPRTDGSQDKADVETRS